MNPPPDGAAQSPRVLDHHLHPAGGPRFQTSPFCPWAAGSHRRETPEPLRHSRAPASTLSTRHGSRIALRQSRRETDKTSRRCQLHLSRLRRRLVPRPRRGYVGAIYFCNTPLKTTIVGRNALICILLRDKQGARLTRHMLCGTQITRRSQSFYWGWRDLISVKAFADFVHFQTTMARMGAVGAPEVYVLQWCTGINPLEQSSCCLSQHP